VFVCALRCGRGGRRCVQCGNVYEDEVEELLRQLLPKTEAMFGPESVEVGLVLMEMHKVV
jgi:hypothetical protein